MSLDKAIEHGKEHRKPYYNSGAFDYSCRPGGDCGYCIGNRMHKHHKRMHEALNQMKEYPYLHEWFSTHDFVTLKWFDGDYWDYE